MRYVILLLTLLFSIPASAVDWNTSTIQPGKGASATWETGDTTETGALKATNCGRVSLAFDADLSGTATTAAATATACASKSAKDGGQCSNLVLADGTSSIIDTVRYPLIYLTSITAPGAGDEAQVRAVCQETFSNLNVLSGEAQLAELKSIETLQAPPQDNYTIYYDPDGGSDANTGMSMDQALGSLDKVGDAISERPCGVTVVAPGGATAIDIADFGTCGAPGLDCGLGPLQAECYGQPDAVAIWLKTDDNTPFTVDCTNAVDDGSAIVSASQTGADGGWIVVENWRTASACATDAFDTSGDNSKLLVLNSIANSTSGTSNQTMTTHEVSKLVGINVSGDAVSPAASGQAVGITDSSTVSIINGHFTSDGDLANESCFSITTDNGAETDPMKVSWIDGSCSFTNPGAVNVFALNVRNNQAPAKETEVYVSDLGLDASGAGAGAACIRTLMDNNSNGSSLIGEFSRISCTGSGNGHTVSVANSAGSTQNLTFRDNIYDGMGAHIFFHTGAGTGTTLNFINTLVDQDDPVNPFGWNGNHASIAAYFTACGASCPLQELTDIAAVQWGTETGGFPCLSGQACYGAGSCYNVPLAQPIPAFVLGYEVTSIQRCGENPHIGAR